MKASEVTDEYILSRGTVGASVAAKYLHTNAYVIYDGVKSGKIPGIAYKGTGEKYVYKIDAQSLYDYKHGIKRDAVKELKCEIAQLSEKISMLLEAIKIG